MKKSVVVIGGGFAGISAATYLAKEGHDVTLLEKHKSLGGRARSFENEGFVFDMGPSWYWMPDVFESFFKDFGEDINNHLDLKRLNPSYRVFFHEEAVDIPADYTEFKALFESYESGAGDKLDKFLKDAEYKYNVGINDLVQKPSLKITEFIDAKIIIGAFKMHLFKSFSKYIRKYFSHPRILELLEFPVLFLGAKPEDTPALYSLMNYADIKLGTWYPMGGMHTIIQAMHAIAIKQGVKIVTNAAVTKLVVSDNKVIRVSTSEKHWDVDAVVGGADYHFIETQLLEAQYQSYPNKYWDSRLLAPSSLIFYLGVDKKIDQIKHHNLFFDADFALHAKEIYDHPQWPEKPLFYVCCPSKTDPSVAPEGKENLFILMPMAPDLEDGEVIREKYFTLIMDRLEDRTNTNIRNHIIYKKSFCVSEFKSEYNSLKGNAYGLANTLKQTAIFKPKMKSKRVNNLFYAGQLTAPGPGVPPSIISGKVVSKLISKS